MARYLSSLENISHAFCVGTISIGQSSYPFPFPYHRSKTLPFTTTDGTSFRFHCICIRKRKNFTSKIPFSLSSLQTGNFSIQVPLFKVKNIIRLVFCIHRTKRKRWQPHFWYQIVANAVRALPARVSASAPALLGVWSRLGLYLYRFLLSSLSDRFCKEKLRMSRFAKRGNTVQLCLGVRLCLFRGRRMGDILRMAFTQNRVRSYTGASLSLTVCLLSYGPPSISLTQPFTHHSISCDP